MEGQTQAVEVPLTSEPGSNTAETEELETSNYTAKLLQGPPPLIPDSTKLQSDVRRVKILNPQIVQAAPHSSMSLMEIPGVYFGYQLQEDYRQLQQVQRAPQEQEHSPTKEQGVVDEPETTSPEPEPTDCTHLQEAAELTPPVTDEEFKFPPPLIPTSSLIIYPTQSDTFSKPTPPPVPQKSPPALNFVKLQVLSSINGSASSIQQNSNSRTTASIDFKHYPNLVETTNGYVTAVDTDGFRPVPTLVPNNETTNYTNTGIQHRPLTTYEQNLLKELQIQSSREHYTVYNTNSVSTISNATANYTHANHQFATLQQDQGYTLTPGNGRKKRQKKTREEKLAYLRQYARDRRARETPEQREARLADLRARQRARKANETPEQRKLRLERDRLKTGRYRAKKKQDEFGRSVLLPGEGLVPYTLS